MEITEESREFTITNEDGSVQKVIGKVVTTTDGFDKDGNPVRSVEIKVPPLNMGIAAGQNG